LPAPDGNGLSPLVFPDVFGPDKNFFHPGNMQAPENLDGGYARHVLQRPIVDD
jgi:hypothetical protein